ncbi:MAG: hypothetical protein HY717_07370 [Planctomycetes bacterium]|nr:hypothetical protein [Planctomycetota bacterium]
MISAIDPVAAQAATPPGAANFIRRSSEAADCRRTFPLSSDSLHDLLLQLHQCGSAGRPHLNFIQALLAMAMAKLHLGLGYTSVAIYAEKNFGCRAFQTYDYLKIARALTYLPLANKAYLDGTIGWPELRLIALVASGLNEKKWIEFAATHSLPDLEEEVRRVFGEEAQGYLPALYYPPPKSSLDPLAGLYA